MAFTPWSHLCTILSIVFSPRISYQPFPMFAFPFLHNLKDNQPQKMYNHHDLHTLHWVPEIQLTEQEKKQIVYWMDHFFGFAYFRFHTPQEQLPFSFWLVAREKQNIIGFVQVQFISFTQGPTELPLPIRKQFESINIQNVAKRAHLFVIPQCRGKGIGKLLSEVSIEKAKNKASVLFAMHWVRKHGNYGKMILQQNGFQHHASFPAYWSEDSLAKKYLCPECQSIPCSCLAEMWITMLT
jgi:GNAT superfamily N-acetyltransferase